MPMEEIAHSILAMKPRRSRLSRAMFEGSA